MEPKLKQIYRLIIEPGVWRDYTTFASPGCTDATWFRFFHGRLKKMGGYKYIAGLSVFTLMTDFENTIQNTEPSYPAKQYINQDLTKPYEATFIDADATPYDNYNFNTPGVLATGFTAKGLTSTGYRIPRKIINVVLDGVNQLIVTADYNQPGFASDTSFGGIAFGQVLSDISETNLVNGRFPALDSATPPVRNDFGYTPNTTYVWSLDYVNLTTGFESADTSTYIVAHPSCGTGGISDPTNRYVFIIAANNLVDGALMSPISSSTPVTTATPTLVPPYATEVTVSGGVCTVGPFLFAYGNNGLIRNSDVNNPLKWANPGSPDWQYNPGLANDVNVCNSKIVKGVSVRGMGTYAALFWSLDSIILATFVGSPSVFSYTVVATNVSIIAPNSVVERSGDYFWIGDGRFFSFSGGHQQEVPNLQNRAWFFDNVNPEYEHLIWGCINPKFTEIWWAFPKGNSTECNWALIYNYESNVWYDTPLDRSAGVYSSIFGAPLWCDSKYLAEDGSFNIYLHEQGNDGIGKQGNATAIPANFITGDIAYLSSSQPGGPKSDSGLIQNWLQLWGIEPNALLTGEWNLSILSRRYANSPIETSRQNYSFNNETGIINMRNKGRIMQMKVETGSRDSSFYLGSFMLTANPTDGEGY